MEEKKILSQEEKEKRIQEIERLKEEKLEENIVDEFTPKNKIPKIITYLLLSIALVLMIALSIQVVIKSENIVAQITTIVSTFALSIFTIFFLFTSLIADNKKGRVFIILASLLLIFYASWNLLTNEGIINKKEVVVENFYGKDITEVVTWAKKYDIFLEQIYEYSDSIEKYKVISQSITPGTSIKEIDAITVVISDGPNPEKEAVVPNMIGWTLDKALKYIDENYLSNVNIEFEFRQDYEKDIIFSQNLESTMKRNERIDLKVSLGKERELKYVTMKNLIGMDEFHATVWLKRNYLAYEINYGYSEEIEQGKISKQSVKEGKIINLQNQKPIEITIARNHEITVPNFKEMTATEITNWGAENKIKITLKEEADDSIAKGKVITSSKGKGDTVEVGELIEVTISKGQVYMIKFTSAEDFRSWAEEIKIAYNIDYQFSTTVPIGELISSSHKENQLIKNTDTVQIIVSQGGTTKIPDFDGMTKKEVEVACQNANLICEYAYENSDTIEKDKVIKQSMRKESEVPTKTTITITLSKGKE